MTNELFPGFKVPPNDPSRDIQRPTIAEVRDSDHWKNWLPYDATGEEPEDFE